MVRSDSKRRCEACGLPGDDFQRRGFWVIPWNALVRARTHEGNNVYLCPSCKTPVERTRRRFKASPAAAAALRSVDRSIIEFECQLPRTPATTYEGLLPAMCDDGKFRLFEWPEEGLDEPLVIGYFAAHTLSSHVPAGTKPESADEARQLWKKALLQKGGLPPAARAAEDWSTDKEVP